MENERNVEKPTKIFVKKIRILFTQDYIRSQAQNETVGRQKRIVSISFLKLKGKMYAYFLWWGHSFPNKKEKWKNLTGNEIITWRRGLNVGRNFARMGIERGES